jgi:nicotinamidase-related amidase
MLNANEALILMIDVQEKLVKATGAELEAQNAKKMIDAGNILNIPVVVSEQYPKGLGSTVDFIEEILTKETQKIEKTSFSLLGEEKALDLIKSFNKKQIIIFGIETHICVLQTAIELVEKGFDVYLIKNASKSRQSFEHESGIDVMKNEKVNILTLEIALFELLRTSKNPNFKAVQALIK